MIIISLSLEVCGEEGKMVPLFGFKKANIDSVGKRFVLTLSKHKRRQRSIRYVLRDCGSASKLRCNML